MSTTTMAPATILQLVTAKFRQLKPSLFDIRFQVANNSFELSYSIQYRFGNVQYSNLSIFVFLTPKSFTEETEHQLLDSY
jgi:hypothetical protein